MTLSHLRALLALALHTDGPTPPHIARLGSTVTVEDLARAYLGYFGLESAHYSHGLEWGDVYGPGGFRWGMEGERLDLTHPGTVNAVRVGLALARGFDPSNGVKWTRNGADNAWILDASDWCAFATSTAARSVTPSRRVIEADLVGNEPDAVRSLVLAVEHVLEVK